jgi:hypothetical protein
MERNSRESISRVKKMVGECTLGRTVRNILGPGRMANRMVWDTLKFIRSVRPKREFGKMVNSFLGLRTKM